MRIMMLSVEPVHLRVEAYVFSKDVCIQLLLFEQPQRKNVCAESPCAQVHRTHLSVWLYNRRKLYIYTF